MNEKLTICINKKIYEWIKSLDKSQNVSDKDLINLNQFINSNEKYIPMSCIKDIFQLNPGKKINGFYFHELMDGIEITLPTIYQPKRNEELEKRCQRLRDQLAQKEYNLCIKNLTTNEKDSFSKDLKSMDRQLMSIINCILTIIGAFFFAFKASVYLFPTDNFAGQLICGMMAATLVFIADIYFLIKNDLLNET